MFCVQNVVIFKLSRFTWALICHLLEKQTATAIAQSHSPETCFSVSGGFLDVATKCPPSVCLARKCCANELVFVRTFLACHQNKYKQQQQQQPYQWWMLALPPTAAVTSGCFFFALFLLMTTLMDHDVVWCFHFWKNDSSLKLEHVQTERFTGW